MSIVIGQARYKLNINGRTNYDNITKEQLSSNIVPILTGSEDIFLNKIGIQAPIGTIVTINDSNIMIGRSGVYEINSTIKIKSLYIPEVWDEDAEGNVIQTQTLDDLNNIIIDYTYNREE